jgi:hypothetical protein
MRLTLYFFIDAMFPENTYFAFFANFLGKSIFNLPQLPPVNLLIQVVSEINLLCSL